MWVENVLFQRHLFLKQIIFERQIDREKDGRRDGKKERERKEKKENNSFFH